MIYFRISKYKLFILFYFFKLNYFVIMVKGIINEITYNFKTSHQAQCKTSSTNIKKERNDNFEVIESMFSRKKKLA